MGRDTARSPMESEDVRRASHLLPPRAREAASVTRPWWLGHCRGLTPNPAPNRFPIDSTETWRSVLLRGSLSRARRCRWSLGSRAGTLLVHRARIHFRWGRCRARGMTSRAHAGVPLRTHTHKRTLGRSNTANCTVNGHHHDTARGNYNLRVRPLPQPTRLGALLPSQVLGVR